MESQQDASVKLNLFVRDQLSNVGSWLLTQSHNWVPSQWTPAKQNSPNSNEPISLLSNFESFLVELQTLLIWEKPINSITGLLIFSFLYWFLVLWSPRLIAAVAITLFCYHFYEMWVQHVWPEIRVSTAESNEKWTSVNPNVLSAPEIKFYMAKLKNLVVVTFAKIVDFRSRSHGIFCCVALLFLSALHMLGTHIPGAILLYTLIMSLALIPGLILYVMPSYMMENLLNYCSSLSTSHVAKPSELHNDNLSQETNTLFVQQSANDETDTSSSSSTSLIYTKENQLEITSQPESGSSSDISDSFEFICDSELDEMTSIA